MAEPPIVKRSFAPVVRDDARLLILGSLPGEASLSAGRYYAHPRNQFWQLTGALIAHDLPAMAYEARLAALTEARIALWDMVASGERKGSLDGAIRVAALNDLTGLIGSLPHLQAIAFNGAKAAALGRRALGKGLEVQCLTLPSSSPAYTMPLAAKAEAWLQLRPFL